MATVLGRHCGGEARGVAAAGEGGRGAMGARGRAGSAAGDGGGEVRGGPVPFLSPSLPSQVRRHGRRLPVPRRLRPGAQPAGAAPRLHV